MTPRSFWLGASLILGCAGSAASTPPADTPARVEPTAAVQYEVHEWGLIRGTTDDRVMLSGPRAPEPVLAVTKPVLYFHRRGEGPLVVDVEAHIPNGRVVEHWPSNGQSAGNVAAWPGVSIGESACRGSRYPGAADDPCRGLTDGCESATLASVETMDSNCLYWPRPPGDEGPTEAWNHLFYRGEIVGAHSLPIRAEPQADGTLRLTARGATPIPGRVFRIRPTSGFPGIGGGLAIVTPPAPGESVVVAEPTQPLSSGPEALRAMLREVGLTSDEADAFARAWNDGLFGAGARAESAPASTEATTTTPMTRSGPPVTSILYVLPSDAADAVATLRFTPPPTIVRRAIVVWIDEAAAR